MPLTPTLARLQLSMGAVAELADAGDLKSSARKSVWVRLPPAPPKQQRPMIDTSWGGPHLGLWSAIDFLDPEAAGFFFLEAYRITELVRSFHRSRRDDDLTCSHRRQSLQPLQHQRACQTPPAVFRMRTHGLKNPQSIDVIVGNTNICYVLILPIQCDQVR
jgi:hypothetical protein